MIYQSCSPRTPGLRLPAQSAPVDRTGTRTSANGDGRGLEAAQSWWEKLHITPTLPTRPTLFNNFV
jgi:hypothetical protein